MPSDRKPVGLDTSSRLASRMERTPLQRATMPGGGEYFSGPLASRALKSLGARAITVDQSIVVGDDFNPSRPESQALYAHERIHQEGSGGQGGQVVRDAEEIAARATESMVLHRAASGDSSFGSSDGGLYSGGAVIHRSVQEGGASTVGNSQPAAGNGGSAAERGYAALVRQGLTHNEIIDRLVEECSSAQGEQDALSEERFKPGGAF